MKDKVFDIKLTMKVSKEDIIKILKQLVIPFNDCDSVMTASGIALSLNKKIDIEENEPLIQFFSATNDQNYDLTIQNLIQGVKLYATDTGLITTIINDDDYYVLDFDDMVDEKEIKTIIQYALFGKELDDDEIV